MAHSGTRGQPNSAVLQGGLPQQGAGADSVHSSRPFPVCSMIQPRRAGRCPEAASQPCWLRGEVAAEVPLRWRSAARRGCRGGFPLARATWGPWSSCRVSFAAASTGGGRGVREAAGKRRARPGVGGRPPWGGGVGLCVGAGAAGRAAAAGGRAAIPTWCLERK